MKATDMSQRAKSLDEDVEAAIAFRIAENAKKQVWNWAKWILSIGVVLLTIMGIRGYTDFQNTKEEFIEGLNEDIDNKVGLALKKELAEVEDAIKDFGIRAQKQYTETILYLERAKQQSEQNLRQLQVSIDETRKRVKDLVSETKIQFTKELQEVRKSKEDAIVAIRSHRGVVEPPYTDGLRRAFPAQWHLKRTTINGKTLDQHASVVDAWNLTMGEGVTIAIIGDGFDLDHEEFRGPNKIVFPRDVTRGNNNPRPGPGENQGTAVMGVAAANGLHGAAGVAPRARLMPIRLQSGLGSQAEANAFVWATDHGADVISVSWGPPDGRWWDESDPQHNTVVPLPDSTRLAIDYATSKGRNGKGTVIVWSAGNGNESVDNDGYASYERVIAVASTNDQGTRATYSDFGNAIWCAFPSGGASPTVLAPGIWTTDVSGSVGYNPGNTESGDADGNYVNDFGGTASAAPGVAGVAALIISVNAELRWDEVKDILKMSSDKIDEENGRYDENGHSQFYGYGRVNALRAVDLARTYQRTEP